MFEQFLASFGRAGKNRRRKQVAVLPVNVYSVSYQLSVLLVLLTLTWDLGMAEGETVKRDLIRQHPELDYLQLGNFGPISRLSYHPAFASLGLTPQQSAGFMSVLLQNGFINPFALRLPNGQPLGGGFYGPPVLPGAFYGVPPPSLDPYVLYLSSHHAKYLPFGLGAQGIYGSTGLPKPRPFGVFNYNDKN